MTPWYFRLFGAFIYFSPGYILYWWRHFLTILKAFSSVTKMYRWFTWITSKIKTVDNNKAHVERQKCRKMKVDGSEYFLHPHSCVLAIHAHFCFEILPVDIFISGPNSGLPYRCLSDAEKNLTNFSMVIRQRIVFDTVLKYFTNDILISLLYSNTHLSNTWGWGWGRGWGWGCGCGWGWRWRWRGYFTYPPTLSRSPTLFLTHTAPLFG